MFRFIIGALVKIHVQYLMCYILPQSNELTNSKTFVSRGSSHQRKSDAWYKFDMVWPYRSPIPVGRMGGGGYFTRSNDFYQPSLRLEEGGSAPCAMHHAQYYYREYLLFLSYLIRLSLILKYCNWLIYSTLVMLAVDTLLGSINNCKMHTTVTSFINKSLLTLKIACMHFAVKF